MKRTALAFACLLPGCTYQALRLNPPADEAQPPGDPLEAGADSGDSFTPHSDHGPGDPFGGADPFGGGDLSAGADPHGPGDPTAAADPTPACPMTPLCSTDVLTGSEPTTGWLAIPASTDLVPLCSGDVMVGDLTENRLTRVNLFDETRVELPELSAPPGAMAADGAHGIIWVAVGGAVVAMQESGDGPQAFADLGLEITDLAVGPPGKAFAVAETITWLALRQLDRCSGDVISFDPDSQLEEMIAYDPMSRNLFTHRVGGSGGQLRRFTVNPATRVYTWAQAVNAGDNCRDLEVSPNGAHLVLACGAGNGGTTAYSLTDFRPTDLVSLGEWQVGAYPRSATFSPDSAHMASGRYPETKLERFSTGDHTSLGELSVDLAQADCSNAELLRVRYSRGGQLLIALISCDASRGLLVWHRL